MRMKKKPPLFLYILLLEQVYLAMLAQAGFDMALLNVLRRRSMATGYLCDAIQNAGVLSRAEIKI